jgi:hypothetical protein
MRTAAQHLRIATDPITIDLGRVVSDRPGQLTFFYFEPVVFGRWYQASIKRTKDGGELWLMTFHVASTKEVHRMSNKYQVLRAEIV